jgi:hypothetical protein
LPICEWLSLNKAGHFAIIFIGIKYTLYEHGRNRIMSVAKEEKGWFRPKYGWVIF